MILLSFRLSHGYDKGADEEAVDDDRYRMNHQSRGEFIIINNKKFHKSTRQGTRAGNEVDEKNLTMELERLGFKVTVHNDRTAANMLHIMITG